MLAMRTVVCTCILACRGMCVLAWMAWLCVDAKAREGKKARERDRETERQSFLRAEPALPAQQPWPVFTNRPDKDHRRSAVRRVRGGSPLTQTPRKQAKQDRETEETERQRDRETERQRDRESARETEGPERTMLRCSASVLHLERERERAGVSECPPCIIALAKGK